MIFLHTNGGNDLRIYTYFARLALHGHNPFTSPANGLFLPIYGNSPPLEMAAFAGLLGVHDSPMTLRVIFGLADVAVIWLIGMYYPRSKSWRLAFLLFYAFNPFVLVSWSAFSEDKTILFFLIAAWLLALERDREWWAWAVGTGLAVFKFLGVFAAPMLALWSYRKSRWRMLIPAAAALTVFAASNLPWFPHSLNAFARRDAHLGINPIHASPLLVLARLHLYSSVEPRLFLVLAIAAVFVLYASRRIEIREAVVWALFSGYIFLPDDPFNRLLLITLPFLLLVEFTAKQWIALWVVSCMAALGVVIATHGVPHALSPLASVLRAVFSREGSPQHVLWINLVPALTIGFYLIDRRPTRTRTT
ncbi:MAG TPA: hypothetical protein VMU90_00250 [Solirubrobacteraceae bacterium]|nr:hypothetical protein [Solirubrobacteraceae bacterium]